MTRLKLLLLALVACALITTTPLAQATTDTSMIQATSATTSVDEAQNALITDATSSWNAKTTSFANTTDSSTTAKSTHVALKETTVRAPGVCHDAGTKGHC